MAFMVILRKTLLVLLAFFPSFALGENDFYGEWVTTGGSECPNFLVFRENREYRAFNDCFAENHRTGLVQEGKYSLSKENLIHFYPESTIEGYNFLHEIGGEKAAIESVTTSELTLCVPAEKPKHCSTIRFRRVAN